MMLTLTASIMYWSLLQSTDESESSPSSLAATPEASPAPSVNGDEISNLSIDDAASDSTVSSTHENNDIPLQE